MQHVYLDLRLIVCVGGEDLRFASWDCCVPLDHLRGNGPFGLNSQSEGRYVEQENVFDISLEHAGLQGRAGCYHLVGIHSLVRLLAGQLLDELLDSGHARRTSNQDEVVEFLDVEASVLDGLLERLLGPLD